MSRSRHHLVHPPDGISGLTGGGIMEPPMRWGGRSMDCSLRRGKHEVTGFGWDQDLKVAVHHFNSDSNR